MDAKYISNFCIWNIIIDCDFDLHDSTCHAHQTSVADIQLLLPVKYVLSFMADDKALDSACKWINDPSLMLDLNWNVTPLQVMYRPMKKVYDVILKTFL